MSDTSTPQTSTNLPNHVQKVGLQYAFQGLLWAYRTQINIKIHLGIVFLVIAAGFFFSLSKIEWFFILSAMFSVLITETINTSIEQTTDAITKEFDAVIKRSKDLAAGAVLLSAVYASIIGILVFLPRIL